MKNLHQPDVVFHATWILWPKEDCCPTTQLSLFQITGVKSLENQIWETLLYDGDLDGNPDIMFMDKDENGKSDVKAYDYDQDGEWDKFEKIT